MSNYNFKPEEFIVEEIAFNGQLLEKDKQFDFGVPEDQMLERDFFTYFIMQKREWNTLQALNALANRIHVKPGRFNFAGTKDRNAISTQICSAFAIPPERLLGAKIKDVQINGCWKAKEKIRLGQLKGNRFTLTITKENCGVEITKNQLLENAKKLGYSYPNLFGSQRFGSLRENTDKIGLLMLKEDFQGAVNEFLTGTGENEGETSTTARKRLAEEKDYNLAQVYFPQSLRYELFLIRHLAKNPTDFIGALRKLPRMLQMTFIHAVQSRIFNEFLEKRLVEGINLREGDLVCPSDELGFPDVEKKNKVEDVKKEQQLVNEGKSFILGKLIGYETETSEEEKAALEIKGLNKESFRLKRMPELSSKGNYRSLVVPISGLKVLSETPLVIQFSLPSGAYATTALDYLLSF